MCEICFANDQSAVESTVTPILQGTEFYWQWLAQLLGSELTPTTGSNNCRDVVLWRSFCCAGNAQVYEIIGFWMVIDSIINGFMGFFAISPIMSL